MIPKCSKCNKPSFYYRSYSGEKLCTSHFIRSVEDNVRINIGKNELFTWNDRIMVAASGGKDSSVLLYILYKIELDFPHSEVFALTIEEGAPGYIEYRKKAVERVLNKIIKDMGGKIDHYIVTFKEHYGYTLSEIIKLANSKHTGLNPCSYCGILRRRLLNLMAKEYGATKVATGHNLDDEAQTILMNLSRGDIFRISRIGPKPVKDLEGFVPRVKPLRYVPEEEITLYAYLKNFNTIEGECTYSITSLRGLLRRTLNYLESKNPGFKYRIVKTFDKLLPAIRAHLSEETPQMRFCKKCGEPTTNNLCRTCQILEEIGITF